MARKSRDEIKRLAAGERAAGRAAKIAGPDFKTLKNETKSSPVPRKSGSKTKKAPSTDIGGANVVPKLRDILSTRELRVKQYQQKSEESISEFRQQDFAKQIEMYNQKAAAANRAMYRMRAKDQSTEAFFEQSEVEELLTEKGNFRKFGKRIMQKYENADENAKRRAQDLLLKDYAKLVTATEGMGSEEYERRVKEKQQIEETLHQGELDWKDYRAVKNIDKKVSYADYYAVIQYAEEVGYIDSLAKEDQPDLKKKDYLKFLKEVNAWEREEFGETQQNFRTIEDLKRLEAQQYLDRPVLMGKKYEDPKRAEIMRKRGSRKLGL